MSIFLTEEVANVLDQAFIDIDSGDIEMATQHFSKGMIGVSDLVLNTFMVDMMGLLKLGYVTRKVVDLATVTLKKAIPPAVKKVSKGLTQSELESFKAYLSHYILEV